MNSMITDVWSCLDTMEYQVKKKKDIPGDGLEEWMSTIHEYVCIKRKNSERDILLFFDENNRYYMMTEDEYYSGKWEDSSIFSDLDDKDDIVSLRLPNIDESQKYIMILREIDDYLNITINGNKLKKMYNEIITNELVAYKNAQAQGKISIKKSNSQN